MPRNIWQQTQPAFGPRLAFRELLIRQDKMPETTARVYHDMEI